LFLSIFRILTKEQQQLYDERFDICKKCKYLDKRFKRFCTLCGCYVSAKVKVDYYLDKNNKSINGCPKKFW